MTRKLEEIADDIEALGTCLSRSRERYASQVFPISASRMSEWDGFCNSRYLQCGDAQNECDWMHKIITKAGFPDDADVIAVVEAFVTNTNILEDVIRSEIQSRKGEFR